MAATESAAADEFAALQRSQISHLSHHPSDDSNTDSDAIDSDDNDHKPSYKQTKPSLRFGNSRQTNAARGADDYDDDDDDWDARYGGTSVFSAKDKGYEIPKGEQGRVLGNTGPKGVIADARAAEREKREEEVAKRRMKDRRITRTDQGREEETGRKWYEDESDPESGNEEEDEDGDDSFMKEWRRKRMGEVEALARNGGSGAGRVGKGIVEAVDALGYLEAVDGAARGMVVVVYISDSEVGTVQFWFALQRSPQVHPACCVIDTAFVFSPPTPFRLLRTLIRDESNVG